jgi:hypothetical protein
MPVWSRNHRACETTWTTLFALGQLRAPFQASGAITMDRLLFWAGSAQARKTRAEALSHQLDNVFRLLRGARFEDGVDRLTATTNLRDTLVVKENTVAALAEAADELYRFFGEESGQVADDLTDDVLEEDDDA